MSHETTSIRSSFERVADGLAKLFRVLPERTDLPRVLELQPEHARDTNPYVISPYAKIVTHAAGISPPSTAV